MRILKMLYCMFLVSISFIMTGCYLLPYYRTPQSITIDDEKYVSGFYGDLYAIGLEYKEFHTALFEKKNHFWWCLNEAIFDLYYCEHRDSIFWNPTIYCKKSQFDTVRNYYANTENYDYYLGIYLEPEHSIKMNDNVDRIIFEQAVSFLIEVEKEVNTKKFPKAVLYLDNEEYCRPAIYRVSKDGLFTTKRSEWIFYQGQLYLLNFVDGSNGQYSLFIVKDEVSDYIAELLNEYYLVGDTKVKS